MSDAEIRNASDDGLQRMLFEQRKARNDPKKFHRKNYLWKADNADFHEFFSCFSWLKNIT